MKFKNFNKPKVNNGLEFLYQDEVEAINGYEKVIKEFETMDLPEELKKTIFEKLEYIIKDEVEHCNILTDLIQLINTQK